MRRWPNSWPKCCSMVSVSSPSCGEPECSLPGGSLDPYNCCRAECRKSEAGDWSGDLSSRPGMKSRDWPMRSTRWRRISSAHSGRSSSGWGKCGRLEEKYRDLIEHSPEMIYQLDRSGQFVHVNKTGLDKLGYQLERNVDDEALGCRPTRTGGTRAAISRAARLSRAELRWKPS